MYFFLPQAQMFFCGRSVELVYTTFDLSTATVDPIYARDATRDHLFKFQPIQSHIPHVPFSLARLAEACLS
jgi:hypothetical protein